MTEKTKKILWIVGIAAIAAIILLIVRKKKEQEKGTDGEEGGMKIPYIGNVPAQMDLLPLVDIEGGKGPAVSTLTPSRNRGGKTAPAKQYTNKYNR